MFARLFERDGEQVLVRETEEEDKLLLVVETQTDDYGSVTTSYLFKDTPEGWDARREKLETITEDVAFEISNNIHRMVSSWGEDERTFS